MFSLVVFPRGSFRTPKDYPVIWGCGDDGSVGNIPAAQIRLEFGLPAPTKKAGCSGTFLSPYHWVWEETGGFLEIPGHLGWPS